MVSDWMKPNFKRAVKLLPEAPVVIEIGAHKGDGVRYMLRKRPKAQIYAIEPCRISFEKLRAFHDKSTRVAISDKVGVASMMIMDNSRRNMLGRSGSLTVEKMPLDDYVNINEIKKIDLIRFDCYGAEYTIFRTKNNFLNITDMICITLQKAHVCPKYINVKKERKHIVACLKGAGFKCILSKGKGLNKHIYQVWRKK